MTGRHVTRRSVFAGAAAASVSLATPLLASRPPRGRGLLDGRSFRGVLAPADGGREIEDSLHFEDGYYWSHNCIACNFEPGAYWTRELDGTISFRGSLVSARSGVFIYEGTATGTAVDVRIGWHRERWYWTVRRGFVFSGQHKPAADGALSLDEAFERAAGERADFCTL